MKRLSWIFLIAVLSMFILLNGCGGSRGAKFRGETSSKRMKAGTPVRYPLRIIKMPDIESTSETRIGDSMIAAFNVQIIPALVLEKDINYEVKWAGNTNIIVVEKGKLRLILQDNNGRFFSGIVRWKNRNDKIIDGGIYLYNDESKPPLLFFKYDSGGELLSENIPKINVNIIDTQQFSESSFKRELVYSGKSGNTITILYREYMNDMARPAFSQELKYDLSDSKTIGYKNAKFEVVDADNMSIHFKTLEQLE
jgi:hypothetical protein